MRLNTKAFALTCGLFWGATILFATVWLKVPIWSSEDAKATSPYLETRPYVGLTPTTPQSAAGWRMEPPVSVPVAAAHRRAATAAAEPPEEPPGTTPSSQGFLTGP